MDQESLNAGFCKEAFSLMPGTGGGQWSVPGPMGTSAFLGYDYLLGAMPWPNFGLRYGNGDHGLSLSGPFLGLDYDQGMSRRGWSWNKSPTLWNLGAGRQDTEE